MSTLLFWLYVSKVILFMSGGLACAVYIAAMVNRHAGQWIERFAHNIRSLLQIPPVVLDGALYMAIAFFGALSAGLGSDEAYKYVEPYTLYWVRFISFVSGQTLLALKMFRNTSYATHVEGKKSDTGIWQIQSPPTPGGGSEKKDK